MRKEKFRRGDLVRIAKDLGPSMEHFRGKGCRAIVIGSYRDKYGGDNTKSYTLFIEGSGKTSWYDEHQLTLIERGRHDLLEMWEDQIDAKIEHESSLPWIVEHWSEIRKNMSSTSILTLFRAIGLQSSFESNGEYYCLFNEWFEMFNFFDHLITKSLEEIRLLQRVGASKDHTSEIERCWHAIHDQTEEDVTEGLPGDPRDYGDSA